MPFPFIPLAIAAGSAISEGLSNRKSARTSSESGTITDAPNLTPEHRAFLNNLFRQYMEQGAFNPADAQLDERRLLGELRNSELAGRTRINQISSNIRGNTEEALRQRGLSFSPGPVSNAIATAESTRGQLLSDLASNLATQRFNLVRGIEERRADLPFMIEDLNQRRLSSAAQFASNAPFGTTRTINTQSVGPGSPLSGIVSGAAQGLAFGAGAGLFSRRNSSFDPSYGQGG